MIGALRAWANIVGDALRAEWTKAHTTQGAAWLLVAIIAITVGVSWFTVAVTTCEPGACGRDPVPIALTGVQVSQVLAAMLAVLVISGEYSAGMMQSTLIAVPRRSAVFAAKALIVGGGVALAAVAAVCASLVIGAQLLPAAGFTDPDGASLLSLTDPATVRAAAGSVLYLVLIALLALGAAAAVRDSAATIGSVLGLLFLAPLMAQVVSNEQWQDRLLQIGPMTAGLAVQATRGLADLPIGPWPGLGVLATWTATGLAAGTLSFLRRDA
jgi:ABC-2 type transport system permease protein